MKAQSESQDLILKIERSANRKFRYAETVRALIETTAAGGKTDLLLEVAFLAKFLTRSFGIMKRIGSDGEGYEKLSAESEAALAKVVSLLRSLGEGLPEEMRKRHEDLFFGLTQEHMKRLVELLEDLTLVKNWTLDGGLIPGMKKS